jgi:uncharacterized membrane protein
MDPIDDINNYKWGVFYYNPSDPRTLVPKRIRLMGWQLNYAHRGSYIAIITLISSIIILAALIS